MSTTCLTQQKWMFAHTSNFKQTFRKSNMVYENSIEYEILDQLDNTIDAMFKRDDAVPDIEKWDKELQRRWDLGLPVDGYMQQLRQDFAELSIQQRFWCRAYGELISFSRGLGKFGQNWVSVTVELQPDTTEYQQSEIGQFVNRVFNEASKYFDQWSNDFGDELEVLNER